MTKKKEKARLQKGQAHIEYLAVKKTVDDLVATGYDLMKIYTQLKNAGQISMSYQAFHENRNRGRKKGKLKSAQFQNRLPLEPEVLFVNNVSDKARQRQLLEANTKASLARNDDLVNQNTNQVVLSEEDKKRKDEII